MGGLPDRTEQLANGRPQIHVSRVGTFRDLVPRRGLDLFGGRAALFGQLEKLLAAFGFARGDQALVVEQLQRRVHRTGARLPQSVAALGDLLDHLVAVHRPLGQQRQDGRSHVAALAATRAAPAPSAAPATGSEAEARAEAWTEARTESGAESERAVVATGVIAQMLAEVSSGLAPCLVQGAP